AGARAFPGPPHPAVGEPALPAPARLGDGLCGAGVAGAERGATRRALRHAAGVLRRTAPADQELPPHRDESYFLPMYLGDYRAAEYLASRADWNGKTLVVMGTSMGGQQGFAVAGLDTLVTALIAHVPAGCDWLGPLHGRAAPYPNWDVE